MDVVSNPAAVVESIAINAPIATVFAALTDPEHIAQWWVSTDPARATKAEADLRPGGTWKTTGVGKSGNAFTVAGTYVAVEPPTLVEFTWLSDWSPDMPETRVRYELAENGGMTTLTIRHTGFTAESDRQGHLMGWKAVLAWVRDYATSR